MLAEVVSETSLNAGRALVGGVVLDPRRRDPHDLPVFDLEVDLTSHPTVRTHRPYHPIGIEQRLAAETLLWDEFEDGIRWAHPDTLPAPGAAGMVWVPIAADDDPCVRAAFRDVEHPDFLNVLAGSHTARAEDAPAHVMLDHDVAGALIA
jgi:hypothetical protein